VIIGIECNLFGSYLIFCIFDHYSFWSGTAL